MVISGFEDLKRRLGDISPVSAVVAAANDRHTLQAVFAASRDGVIEQKPTAYPRIRADSRLGDSCSSLPAITIVRPFRRATILSSINASKPTLQIESTAPFPNTGPIA